MAEQTWKIKTDDIKKLGPIREWNRKANAGDMEGLIGIMSARIEAWPFEPSPADTEAYDDLTPDEWGEALRRMSAAFNAVFQQPNGKR